MTNNDDYQQMAIMFVDVEGSTRLYEKNGDQKAQQIIERCLNIVSDTVRKSGGKFNMIYLFLIRYYRGSLK